MRKLMKKRLLSALSILLAVSMLSGGGVRVMADTIVRTGEKGFSGLMDNVLQSKYTDPKTDLTWEYSADSGKVTITACYDATSGTVRHASGNVAVPSYIESLPVTAISGAFSGDGELTFVSLPSGITEIGKYTFLGCSALKEITLPSGITEIGDGAFQNCTGITSINLPSALTSIGFNTFKGMTGLTRADIPESVQKIGAYAFADDAALSVLNLPSHSSSIGMGAFQYDTALKQVSIPSGITELPLNTFLNCKSLAKIGIPKSVAVLGSSAFMNDPLKKIYYEGSEAEWKHISIHEGNSTTGSEMHFDYADLPKLPPDQCQYSVAVRDSATSEPVPDAKAVMKGSTLTADKGYITITAEESDITSDTQITFSADGYQDSTVGLSSLSAAKENQVMLTQTDPSAAAPNFDDLNKGTSPVSGPDVKIGPWSFPMFSTSAGMDFGPIKVQSEVNRADKTVRFLVGCDENPWKKKDGEKDGEKDGDDVYDATKSLVKGADSMKGNYFQNQWSKLKKDFKPATGKVGFEATGSLFGYLEYSYAGGKMTYKEGGVIASYGTELDKKWRIPQTAYLVYVRFKVSADINGELRFIPASYNSSITEKALKIDAKASVLLGIGLGSMSVLGIEGGGELGANIEIRLENAKQKMEDILSITLSGHFYAMYRVFLWSNRFQWPGEGQDTLWSVYPWGKQQNTVSLGASEGDSEDYAGYTMIPRTSPGNSPDGLLQAAGDSANTYEMKDAYPDAQPQLTVLPDGRVLYLWIADNGGESSANRTRLMYSVRSTDGTWSPASAADASGLAAFSPTVCRCGGKCYIFWKRASEVLPEDITLSSILSRMDLVMSVYDGSSFSTPLKVSAPDGRTPLFVSAGSDGSQVFVSWTENSENAVYQEKGTNSLYVRNVTDGTAGELKNFSTDTGYINSIAVSGSGDSVYISRDRDGNPETDGDCDIYRAAEGGSMSAVTSDAGSDTDIKNLDGTIYWNKDGSVYRLSGGSAQATGASCGMQFDVLKVNGAMTVLSTVSDGYTSEIYTTTQEGSAWSTAVPLTSYGTYINAFAAAADPNGKLILAPCRTAVSSGTLNGDIASLTASNDVYGDSDLLVTEPDENYELDVDPVLYYDASADDPGKAISLTASVTNVSTCEIDTEKVTLKDSSGKVLEERTVSVPLEVGETGDVTVSWTLPSDLEEDTISMTVEIPGKSESSTSDNTATGIFGQCDMKVSSLKLTENEDGTGTLSADLMNDGCTTAEDCVVSLYQDSLDSQAAASQSIGSLGEGETAKVIFRLTKEQMELTDENDSSVFLISVSTDNPEENYENNDDAYLYETPDVEYITLNHSGLTMKKGETADLSAEITPTDTKADVRWISDDTSVATVDENGKVTAVSEGEATITALAGLQDTDCRVFVDNGSRGISWKRYGGETRYETASMIAEAAFPNGTEEAVLVSGNDFPDALAAGSYAGAKKIPVLITDSAELSGATALILEKLGVSKVLIIGGTGAVSLQTESELTSKCGIAAGDISRVGGKDRFETAENLYDYGMKDGTFRNSQACFITTGLTAADALSVGPWSYYGGSPVLLAGTDGTLDERALADAESFGKKYIIGGEYAVSAASQNALGEGTLRIGGADRYETSARVAENFAGSRTDGYKSCAFASGLDSHFVDSLTGSMLQGELPSPVLLTDGAAGPVMDLAAVKLRSSAAESFRIFGGTGAVSEDIEDELADFIS